MWREYEKQQVEKHFFKAKCRLNAKVSCLDCGKLYVGDEFKAHTKCISEDEKYSGKSYVPSKNINKGEVKQEQWTEKIHAQLSLNQSLNSRIKSILENMLNYPNIPRKYKKFKNFMENSLKIRDEKMIESIWNIMNASDTVKLSDSSKSGKEILNGNHNTKTTELDKECIQNGEDNHISIKDKFDWTFNITSILEKKTAIPYSVFQTKMIKRYRKWAQQKEGETGKLNKDQIVQKLKKKIKKLKLTISEDGIINVI